MAATGSTRMHQDPYIDKIRSFNRFYTAQLGVLDEGLLDSEFTLTEVRILYELAQDGPASASQIGKALGLDPGYLSRILRKFEAKGLIDRQPSKADARRSLIALTEAGRRAFAPLDAKSAAQAAAWLAPMSEADRRRITDAMAMIKRLLKQDGPSAAPLRLRPHNPGDIGWAIQRHGEIYADEFQWNEEFEGLVAQILGSFLVSHDPGRERSWIAELGDQRAGCIFLMESKESAKVAQLRCLLVDPLARGMGVGSKLVEACIAFAREAGYERIMLWTNDVLVSARRIYEAAGFVLESEEPHHSFGRDLIGQTWGMSLNTEAA
jgi:DNA-binding MarR family transcriptional regulator/ribosomal protein S18 acetylase RimI-like enzyme